MDITKCNGEGCPIKEQCYRYTTPAHPHQSWMAPPWNGRDCDYFWKRSRFDPQNKLHPSQQDPTESEPPFSE